MRTHMLATRTAIGPHSLRRRLFTVLLHFTFLHLAIPSNGVLSFRLHHRALSHRKHTPDGLRPRRRGILGAQVGSPPRELLQLWWCSRDVVETARSSARNRCELLWSIAVLIIADCCRTLRLALANATAKL